MRPTRTRRAPKRAPDEVDPDDMDSDEFEAFVSSGVVPAARKKQKRRAAADAPAGEAADAEADAAAGAAAAAPAAAAAVKQEVEQAEEQQEEEEAGSGQSAGLYDDIVSSDEEEGGGASDEPGPAAAAAAAAGDGGAEKKAKEKKAKKPSTQRMCYTYAKSAYGLTDGDINQLTDVQYKDNPHYLSGPPMRLYLIHELEELSRQKQWRREHAAELKEQAAAERAREARERKAAAAAAAAEATRRFEEQATSRQEHHGSLKLPDTCLAAIMCRLAATLEPGGLRGPSAVARELANASLACWDLYHAAKEAGFVALGEAAAAMTRVMARPTEGAKTSVNGANLRSMASLPGPTRDWAFWDSVLQRPAHLKLPKLKDAARQLGVPVTGTKPELMLRVLGAFGLDGPTHAPAQLLHALVLERCGSCWAWDGPDAARLAQDVQGAIHDFRSCGHYVADDIITAQASKGVAGVRATIAARGYESLEAFTTAATAMRLERQRQEREAAQQRAAEFAARREAQLAAQRAALEAQRAAQEARRQQLAAQEAQRRQDWERQQIEREGQGLPRLPFPEPHAPAARQPHPGGHGGGGGLCRCGNMASPTCSRGLCGLCCKAAAAVAPVGARCPRHHC